ncbi:MAG: hypothetical protein R3C58_14540 [Parvularculaceae bacterium]
MKGKDTKPEVTLRKKLFALGLRYRLNVKALPGKPDLVFPKYKPPFRSRLFLARAQMQTRGAHAQTERRSTGRRR